MRNILGLTATLLGLLATLYLPDDPNNAAPAPAAAPQLHMGFQHVPRDGTGRLGGSAVDILERTEHDSVFWPTHVFAELFWQKTHDRYWQWVSTGPAETDGRWSLRPELMREYGELIDRLAGRCLDSVELTLGGREPPERIRVFPDLETATIKRVPYVEPQAGGYGSRDIIAMNLLCNRIEFLGGRRWGDRGAGDDDDARGVEVLAGPYRPLRQFGHWAGLSTEPGLRIQRDWHDPVAPLLDRRVVWVHCYMPTTEEDFNRRGQTWRQYARANIRGQFESILNSGAAPEEVWVWDWVYAAPDFAKSEGLMLGLADVLAERQWPWTTHLGIAGGWGSLRYLIDRPVEQVSNPPLVLTIPADLAGYALAESWVREVEAAHELVFDRAGQTDPAR